MITPKEKAKELFAKFSGNTVHYDAAKQCAMIAVEEIIKSNPTNDNELYAEMVDEAIAYWKEVKKEIENIK